MALERSREDLINFLKREVEKGSIPINTGLSRMASVRKVLSVLSDQEAEDVTKIDPDVVMRRFLVRSEHNYSLASQVSYKSRLRSALADFKASQLRRHQEDPIGTTRSPSVEVPATLPRSIQSIQIPLSRGCTVMIDGLPTDLTEAEAQRISKVLLAYAVSGEP